MHQDIVQTRYWWSGCPRRTAPVQYLLLCIPALPATTGTGAAQQYQKAEPDPTGRVGHDLRAAGLHPLGLPPLSRHVHHRDWIRLAAGRPVWEGQEKLGVTLPSWCASAACVHMARPCSTAAQEHCPLAAAPTRGGDRNLSLSFLGRPLQAMRSSTRPPSPSWLSTLVLEVASPGASPPCWPLSWTLWQQPIGCLSPAVRAATHCSLGEGRALVLCGSRRREARVQGCACSGSAELASCSL